MIRLSLILEFSIDIFASPNNNTKTATSFFEGNSRINLSKIGNFFRRFIMNPTARNLGSKGQQLLFLLVVLVCCQGVGPCEKSESSKPTSVAKPESVANGG